MSKTKPTRKELAKLVLELMDHLDYFGWGSNSWEREISEDLRKRSTEIRPVIEQTAEVAEPCIT